MSMADKLDSLCSNLAHFRYMNSQSTPAAQTAHGLEWVWLHSKTVIAISQHTVGTFLAKVIPGCQPFRDWALDTVTQHIPARLAAEIRANQQQAVLENPNLQANIARLGTPIPPPQAPTQLTDLVTVQPGSAEYDQIQALIQGPMHELKRVVVPERDSRFDAWRLSLPSAYQAISQVRLASIGRLPVLTRNACRVLVVAKAAHCGTRLARQHHTHAFQRALLLASDQAALNNNVIIVACSAHCQFSATTLPGV